MANLFVLGQLSYHLHSSLMESFHLAIPFGDDKPLSMFYLCQACYIFLLPVDL